MAPPQSKCIKN